MGVEAAAHLRDAQGVSNDMDVPQLGADRRHIRAPHLSYWTERAGLRSIRRHVRFHGRRSPRDMSVFEADQFSRNVVMQCNRLLGPVDIH